MVARAALTLPLHQILTHLEAWRADRSDEHRAELATGLQRLADAYGAAGARLTTGMPPIGPLELGVGTLRDPSSADASEGIAREELSIGSEPAASATLLVDGSTVAAAQLADALRLALAAIRAQYESAAQRQQLEALDAAVRGIATIGSVDHVLQLIVDEVRDLVGARYAALGILGPNGRIEQFITSGISAEERARVGDPPQGHGLLGLIIREDRTLLIDDITSDPHAFGFPPHHPHMRSLLGVPVRTKSRTIGNLYLADKIDAPTFSQDDMQLLQKFALHAGIAIDNARLHEEVSRLAIVDERQRISQDLHDSVIQSLYAISLSLEDLPEVMAENPAEGRAQTDHAIDAIHGAIRDIRNFIMGLQPELLGDADLTAGVRTLAIEFSGHTLIDLEVRLDDDLPDLPADKAAHVLAITREALSNAARHSGATRASLELSAEAGAMRLIISDNGRGFEVGRVRSPTQRGLTNLQSRADAIGARLILNSEPGVGTRLELAIPLADGSDPEAAAQEGQRQA